MARLNVENRVVEILASWMNGAEEFKYERRLKKHID